MSLRPNAPISRGGLSAARSGAFSPWRYPKPFIVALMVLLLLVGMPIPAMSAAAPSTHKHPPAPSVIEPTYLSAMSRPSGAWRDRAPAAGARQVVAKPRASTAPGARQSPSPAMTPGRRSGFIGSMGVDAIVTGGTCSTAPGAPTSVQATAGNAQATVTWQAASAGKNCTVSGYTVTSNPESLTAAVGGTTTTATVGNLINGRPYSFTVTATNQFGQGPISAASNTVTPSGTNTAPSAPQSVAATAGNTQATVTWGVPALRGGAVITQYTVTSSPGGLTATSANQTVTVTGLTNGQSYTFTVTATNSAGTSPASSPCNSIAPATVPGAPTGPSATAGNGQATLIWTAPASNGGTAISGYLVTPYVGSTPQAATTFGSPATTETVSGFSNGTAYTFTVAATNALSTRPASTASNLAT